MMVKGIRGASNGSGVDLEAVGNYGGAGHDG